MDAEENVADIRQYDDLQDWLLEIYTGKSKKERQTILAFASHFWSSCEIRLLDFRHLSSRQAFLVMSEVIVDETRRMYLDLAARSKFTKSGETVESTRSTLEEVFSPPEVTEEDMQYKIDRSASRLRTGATVHDLIEIG